MKYIIYGIILILIIFKSFEVFVWDTGNGIEATADKIAFNDYSDSIRPFEMIE